MKWTLQKFALFLAVALTVWLGPSIFGGKVLLPADVMAHTPPYGEAERGKVHNALIADAIYENYSWKKFQRDSVAAGELPLWNPYSFCGHPLYAGGQNSTFYPLNLIFLAMPLPQAYVVFTWLHLFLGGLFTYLFCRQVGVGGFGAAVGGVVFAMCGFLAVRVLWPMLLGSAIWLPLMLLWVDRSAQPRPLDRRCRDLFLGALLFAQPLLAGFTEIAFYAFIAAGLYALRHGLRLARREHRPAAGAFVVANVIGVGALGAVVAAPQLLPFFEVMKLNVRAGESDYDQAVSRALAPVEALNLLAPDTFGNPAKHEVFDLASRKWQPIERHGGRDFFDLGRRGHDYVNAGIYLGLLPLALVVLSIRAPGRERGFFWFLLAFAVCLAFGTPLYALFFHAVPGFEQIRTPFRWMYLATFAAACLAGVGGQRWFDSLTARTSRQAWISSVAVLALAVLLLAATLTLLWKPAWAARLVEPVWNADYNTLKVIFREPETFVGFAWANLFRFAVVTLGAIVLLGLACWRTWRPRGAAFVALAGITFIAFDMGQATYAFNTHADPALLDRRPAIVDHLTRAADEPFRIARFGAGKLFHPNLPMLYGICDVGGYDSIVLTDYVRFLEAIERQSQVRYNIVMSFERRASLDSPLFRLLNVHYLLSSYPVRHPDWEPVADIEGKVELHALRKDKRLPRAFLVSRVQPAGDLEAALAFMTGPDFDPATVAVAQVTPARAAGLADDPSAPPGTAQITAYRHNAVRITTDAAARRFLVLCDMNYPGWNVYVDGVRAELLAADGIFRGVAVPSGPHEVEFRFEPRRLYAGAAASLTCLLLLAGLAAWSGRRRRSDQISAISYPPPTALAGEPPSPISGKHPK